MKEILPFEGHEALLNTNMFKIMFGLRKPLTVLECRDKLNIPQSTLYKHFSYLDKLGLIHKFDTVRYQSNLHRKRTRYICYVSRVEITSDSIVIEYF